MNTVRVTGCKFDSTFFFEIASNSSFFSGFALTLARPNKVLRHLLSSRVRHLLDVKIFGKRACRGLFQSPVCLFLRVPSVTGRLGSGG
jgi:hypothetical protein